MSSIIDSEDSNYFEGLEIISTEEKSMLITSFSGVRVSMAIMMLTRAILCQSFTEDLHTRPYGAAKKGVSGMKHFYWVSIVGNNLKCS